jgi:hypothetical protein
MPARYRVRGNFNSTVPLTETYTRVDGVVSSASGTYCNFGEIQTTHDVVTPKFHQLRSKGVIFNNPFSSVKETRSYTVGTRVGTLIKPTPPAWNPTDIFKVVRNGNNGNWYDTTELPLSTSNAITTAITKAVANVEKPEVEGIPILAELRQTLETLRNPLKGATEFMKREFAKLPPNSGGRRRNSARVHRKAAKDLADQHLSIIFGVMPFLNDIDAVLKSLTKISNPKRKTSRGFASATVQSNGTRAYNDGAVAGTIADQRSRTVAVRAGILYQVDIDLGFSKYGFSISDIPAAAWELTWMSFVVDWLTNVGDLISAMTPKFGVTILSQWYTVTETHINVATLQNGLTSLNVNYAYTGGGDTRTRVVEVKTRNPANLADLTGLVWEPSLTTSNIFASLSLLIQQIGRLKT